MRKILMPLLALFIFISCVKKTENEFAQRISKAGITSCKVYSSDFEFWQSNQKGRLIQEFFYNTQGEITEMVRYNIDGTENGRFSVSAEDSIVQQSFSGKGSFDKTVEVVQMDSAGEPLRKEIFKYDSIGNVIFKILVNHAGDTLRKNRYKYDTLGLIIEDIYWDQELEVPIQVIRYEYTRNIKK